VLYLIFYRSEGRRCVLYLVEVQVTLLNSCNVQYVSGSRSASGGLVDLTQKDKAKKVTDSDSKIACAIQGQCGVKPWSLSRIVFLPDLHANFSSTTTSLPLSAVSSSSSSRGTCRYAFAILIRQNKNRLSTPGAVEEKVLIKTCVNGRY
jgi:hypothetical protein